MYISVARAEREINRIRGLSDASWYHPSKMESIEPEENSSAQKQQNAREKNTFLQHVATANILDQITEADTACIMIHERAVQVYNEVDTS